MNYYNEIKTQLINNEITKKVKDYSKNRSDLDTYYNVGKLLSEAGKHYGEGIIKEYSVKLTKELGKNYDARTLRRFRQFFNNCGNWSTLWTNLSWSIIRELLSINDINKINYYIKKSYHDNLSVRQLQKNIKSKEYERLDELTKQKLITNQELDVKDLVPDPIILHNKNNYDVISEKVLQKIILEDISSFLKELGDGFTYIDNEYKIKLGDTYNYIDLLLYNIKYRCYVVIELKVTELKKEHIGQIQVYMNYIDKTLRSNYEDNTIGIIICKKNNKYIIEYCSDNRVISKEYKVMI